MAIIGASQFTWFIISRMMAVEVSASKRSCFLNNASIVWLLFLYCKGNNNAVFKQQKRTNFYVSGGRFNLF